MNNVKEFILAQRYKLFMNKYAFWKKNGRKVLFFFSVHAKRAGQNKREGNSNEEEKGLCRVERHSPFPLCPECAAPFGGAGISTAGSVLPESVTQRKQQSHHCGPS